MVGALDGRNFDGRKDMKHKFFAWSDSFKLVNTTGRFLRYAVAADPNALLMTSFQGGAHGGAEEGGANVSMTWEFARPSDVQQDTVAEKMEATKHVNMPSGQAYVTVLARSSTGEFYYVVVQHRLVRKGDTFTIMKKDINEACPKVFGEQ
jgi:hypothetical protein